MFRRLLLDDSAAFFTITAFLTAASIYATFAWRALRMQRAQVERFENLPFETPTPASVALRVGAGTGSPDDSEPSRFSRCGRQDPSVS